MSLLDELSDALPSPDIAPKPKVPKPKVLGTLLQKRGEPFAALLLGKFWRTARTRLGLESLLAPLTGLLQPVAYRTVADAKGLSNERFAASPFV